VFNVPRKRADDYDDKKKNILNVAASMFAELGYMGCKMEDIANKCEVSKSMLYYYFPRKEDVLFEILRGHVSSLNQTIEDYLNSAEATDPNEFFRRFIEKYLERSSNARERHAVTLNDTRYLTHDQIVLQENLERRNVELLTQVLKRVNTSFSPKEYKVYALLLIGMINWIELWHRSSGQISRSELYDRVSVLFLHGFLQGYSRPAMAALSASITDVRKEPRGGKRGPRAAANVS
jgi:AcrR family transcriptional regulator